jgi:hypothetical protein
MKNPAITLANDTHRDNPVGRLRFEKDRRLFAKVKAKANNINKIQK